MIKEKGVVVLSTLDNGCAGDFRIMPLRLAECGIITNSLVFRQAAPTITEKNGGHAPLEV